MPYFYQQAEFLKSAPNLKACPPDTGREIAFAGRSNAGKSSALNVLTNQVKLSRISKTPGRTQMLNFFTLPDDKRLVDLPGYGFAKVPAKIKAKWQEALQEYLQDRQSLSGVILLMDIRHPLTKHDVAMLEWSQYNLPIHILLTKSDKLKFGAAKNSFLSVKKQLERSFPNTTISMFSALKKTGVDDLQKIMNTFLDRDV